MSTWNVSLWSWTFRGTLDLQCCSGQALGEIQLPSLVTLEHDLPTFWRRVGIGVGGGADQVYQPLGWNQCYCSLRGRNQIQFRSLTWTGDERCNVSLACALPYFVKSGLFVDRSLSKCVSDWGFPGPHYKVGILPFREDPCRMRVKAAVIITVMGHFIWDRSEQRIWITEHFDFQTQSGPKLLIWVRLILRWAQIFDK